MSSQGVKAARAVRGVAESALGVAEEVKGATVAVVVTGTEASDLAMADVGQGSAAVAASVGQAVSLETVVAECRMSLPAPCKKSYHRGIPLRWR